MKRLAHLLRRGALLLCAALLTSCVLSLPQHPRPEPSARADVLLATERGMRSIVFDASHGYLSLSNTSSAGTLVLRTGSVVNSASVWRPVDLQECALGPARGADALRSPALARLEGKIYLIQPIFSNAKEHSLCQLERAMEWFAPRDQALRVCTGLYCERLWMSEVQATRGVLLSNAGGGSNVLASMDDGRNWRALLGSVENAACTHGAFRIVGNRLLTGGACPLDSAFLRSYALAPDGVSLASTEPLPLVLPALENRHVQFIREAGGSVFAGVAGGMLRSTDGARSFQYVIRQPQGAPHYPIIGSLLALRNRPAVLLAAGFDQASGKPYLALSRNGGGRWSDLSTSLRGYQRPGFEGVTQVTSLVQDPLGRILLTLNLDQDARGRLVLLTLAGVD